MPFLNIRVATRATDALRVQEESVGLQKKMTGQGGGCRLFHMLLQTALGLTSWGTLAARLCILGGSAGPHAFGDQPAPNGPSSRVSPDRLDSSSVILATLVRASAMRSAGAIAANGPCPSAIRSEMAKQDSTDWCKDQGQAERKS